LYEHNFSLKYHMTH